MEPRADRTTAQLIFNGRPEPSEITPAAGALDIAAGSRRHHILRGPYGALILGAGTTIACLKEERCRTGS
jgi:hypothetical protein